MQNAKVHRVVITVGKADDGWWAAVDHDESRTFAFTSVVRDILRRLAHERHTVPPDDLVYLGTELWTVLFSGERRKRMASFLEEVARDPDLHLVFHVQSSFPEVHNWPFELLYHPGYGFLFQRPRFHLVRGVPEAHRYALPPLEPPLRILVVISQPPATYARVPLDPLRELETLYDAIDPWLKQGDIEVEVLLSSRPEEIRRRLDQSPFHILHFSGHARQDGQLLVEGPEGREQWLGPREFLRLLQLSRYNLRLFYLNACETARSGGFTPSLAFLLHREIPRAVVIAHTTPISDRAAIQQVGKVYAQLAQGAPVFRLLQDLRTAPHGEWWVPVLYAGEFQEPLVHLPKPGPAPNERHRVPPRPAFYVYRYPLAREAVDLLQNPEVRFLVLHGVGGMGKTYMARYLAAFLRGRFPLVLYYSLRDDGIASPEDLVRRAARHLGLPETQDLETLARELPEHTLWILDDLEQGAQDEMGHLQPAWKAFLETLAGLRQHRVILASRLRPYWTKREPVGHLLPVGEYLPQEVTLLQAWLTAGTREQQAQARYLAEHWEALEALLGRYPLGLHRALETRPARPEAVLRDPLVQDLVEFYRPYLEAHPRDALWLLSLPGAVPREYVETWVRDPKFLDLLLHRLRLLEPIGDGKLLQGVRAVWSYFRERPLQVPHAGVQNLARELAQELEKDQEGTAPEQRKFLPFHALAFVHLVPMLAEEEVQDLAGALHRAFGILKNAFEKAGVLRQVLFPGLVKALYRALQHLPEEDRARGLNDLAVSLAEVGRKEEALEVIQEAVEIYWRLAEKNPGAYEPYLAGSLSNLANRLAEVGREEEALEVIREAVEIYRRLAGKNPGAYEPYLAMSLSNLANRLAEVGRKEEALEVIREAVEIYRRLAGKNPGAYEADLAMSLHNLANRLAEVGRKEEALEVIQEAVEIYRRLAGKNPGAYMPYLAMGLNNLAAFLSEAGRKEEALEVIQEAVEICRRLAGKNPGAYMPYLAMSLNNLAAFLSEVGRKEEALEVIREAVEIRRRLAERNPGAYEPDLARSLNNLAKILSEVGKKQEAVAALEKAIGVWLKAAQHRSRAPQEALHLLLQALGSLQSLCLLARERADAQENLHRLLARYLEELLPLLEYQLQEKETFRPVLLLVLSRLPRCLVQEVAYGKVQEHIRAPRARSLFRKFLETLALLRQETEPG